MEGIQPPQGSAGWSVWLKHGEQEEGGRRPGQSAAPGRPEEGFNAVLLLFSIGPQATTSFNSPLNAWHRPLLRTRFQQILDS